MDLSATMALNVLAIRVLVHAFSLVLFPWASIHSWATCSQDTHPRGETNELTRKPRTFRFGYL